MNHFNYPTHLGFIVDGNRRWARAKNLPTLEGHRKGYQKVEDICELLAKTPVKFASFFIFSTENWGRSKEEVDYLMNMVRELITSLAKKCKKQNIRCLILGSPRKVAPDILEKLKAAEDLTKDCTGLTICLCFNYGGQQEIVDAARSLTQVYQDRCHAAIHDPSATMPDPSGFFSVENFSQHLYHPEVPPVDLIVRTSGEERFSGFMLWRAAYAEFLFLEKYWPDIEESDLTHIFEEFTKRERRFGK